MFTGHSRISGDLTFSAGSGVSPVSENLSMSLPETIPQKSVCFRISVVGILTTNSPELSISLYECLSGRIPRPNVGGSEQTIPAHARVIMLGFPLESEQVTSTTGQGNKAANGFFFTFMIDFAPQSDI